MSVSTADVSRRSAARTTRVARGIGSIRSGGGVPKLQLSRAGRSAASAEGDSEERRDRGRDLGTPIQLDEIGRHLLDRAGWRGHAGEEIAGPGRTVGVVDNDVEAGEPQRAADRKHHRGDPAEMTEIVQTP